LLLQKREAGFRCLPNPHLPHGGEKEFTLLHGSAMEANTAVELADLDVVIVTPHEEAGKVLV
jgi:hypothetical protein